MVKCMSETTGVGLSPIDTAWIPVKGTVPVVGGTYLSVFPFPLLNLTSFTLLFLDALPTRLLLDLQKHYGLADRSW